MSESRTEDILTAILNDGTYDGVPESRVEQILLAILNQTAYTAEAQSRIEAILLCILNGTDLGIVPQSRVETILECIYNGEAYTGDTQSRIEELLKQISEKEPTPPTPSTFTATFIRADGDGGGTLYTQTDIPAGTVPVYGGETPTTTKGSAADYPFKGWSPALAPITEDTTYTAVFGLAGETIDDDWSTILANPNYATDYSIGDTKAIDLGTEGVHLMEIVAFNEDDRADGNGKAGITWISKDLLPSRIEINDAKTTAGGWGACSLRSYLENVIKPLIPIAVRNGIVEVSKITSTYENEALVNNGQVTSDSVWTPSLHEMDSSGLMAETEGATYTKFSGVTKRMKHQYSSTDYGKYFLRSAATATQFRAINTGGYTASISATSTTFIAIGFCTN